MAILFLICALSGAGVAEADENCVKFLEKTMFSAFEKVCVCMCVCVCVCVCVHLSSLSVVDLLLRISC